MREFINRVLDWFRRDRLERELAEEMRFHRERAARDAMAEGVPADEAPWEARRRFGNATHFAEEARDRWSLPRLEQILQDARYSWRGLRRSPGFAVTAVVTLGLGIGANIAMFGVIDRLMFRPYAYLRDPATAHRVYLQATYRGKQDWGYGGEYTRYLDIRRYTTSFSQIAAFSSPTLALGTGESVKEKRIATVSASFWDFFDARPALGRFFGASEDMTPRGAEVSVLGYAYWKNEFGGRNVVGEKLQVGHIPTTIIGVAPAGFTGVFDTEPAAFIPITLYGGSAAGADDRKNYYLRYNWGWMNTMVRRKSGVSEEQANADVTQAFRRSWLTEIEQNNGGEPLGKAKPSGVVGSMRLAAGPSSPLEAKTAMWVSGVALIVLLIACFNVANLTLARALRRQRETAVRLALGVSRIRLMTQMLTESLILAMLGSVAGLLFAQWAGSAISRVLVTSADRSVQTFSDWRTLGAGCVIAVVTSLIAGLIPAMLAGRGDVAATLKRGPREGMYHRSNVRVGLLVAQGSLSVMLLVGATLFVRSLRHVKDLRMGYDAEQVLLVSTSMRGLTLDSARTMELRHALVETGQAIPGVASVAWVSSVPFWSTSSQGLYVAGIDSVRRLGRFTYQVTTPDFFRTFGTRIVRGRGFTADDRLGAPLVAVVSEAMAATLWPGKDAIGQCMRVRADTMPCTTVVGIAENIVQQQEQLTDTKKYQYYLPLDQSPARAGSYVLLRVTGDASSAVEPVRKALQRIMPGQSYVTARPMIEIVDSARRSWKLGADLFVAFGLLALIVAAVGLYGVMSFNVTQRMHELGVRVALGAQRRDILRLVVGQGARFSLAGGVVGSLLALGASRWVQPLLFQQSARDPVVYVGVCALMVVVALLATATPGMRATKADPNRALRSE